MLDRNDNQLNVGDKVWVADMDEDLWQVNLIDEMVHIKNLSDGKEISIKGDGVLKHAEGGYA